MASPKAIRTLASASAVTAPLFLELDPGTAFVVAGAVGVNTADGLDKHELAATFAAETVAGAWELIVPFPAKLQASGLWPSAS
jgi:hypothetical protein